MGVGSLGLVCVFEGAGARSYLVKVSAVRLTSPLRWIGHTNDLLVWLVQEDGVVCLLRRQR